MAWTDPPSGWYPFGTHAGWDRVPPLQFSDEVDEVGMPLFERPVYGVDGACGGCEGEGRHRRWCRHVVGIAASELGRMSAQAESLGDRVGANHPAVANMLYRVAGELRADADERAAAYMSQRGTTH